MKTNRNDTPVIALYTDIGRGHPNYLDSVLRFIRQNHVELYKRIEVTSIFTISRGLSFLGWQGVKKIYRAGSRGGLISNLYSRFRAGQSGFNSEAIFIKLLSRDLREFLQGYDGICLVAHPLLANMLKDRHRVFYLHGEIAAPAESGVEGVERVYVPLRETREKMLALGLSPDSLVETGLVLEPELCGDLTTVLQQRIERIRSNQPLTIGFFISGAYPRCHLDLMLRGVRSCRGAGLEVRLFWGCETKELRRLGRDLRDLAGEIIVDEATDVTILDAPVVIVTAKSREAETIRSMEYLPGLDIFCAAPHERINWAVGAGLPMIMISPPIGSFAPENRSFVLRSGSGFELATGDDFSNLGAEINRLRQDGRLQQMAAAGRNIDAVHGARTIAADLESRIV